MVIDGGTLIRHASPVPGGLRGPCVRPKEIHLHTLVFSGEMLHRFFRSVARSIVLARRIKLRPMRADPKDDLGVRAIIKMTPDRFLPEEVDLPTEEQIDAEVESESNQFGEQFWQELDKRGVQGVLTYLEDLQAQRENALAKYQDTFRELSRHNEGAEATTQTIVRGLTIVKFSATIIVAGLSLPVVTAAAAGAGIAAGSSLAAFGVGTGYSVSLKLIKDWNKAPQADLLAVAEAKAAEKTGQKGVKEASKFLKGVYENESGEKAILRKREWLTKRIESNEGKYVEKAAQNIRRLGRAQDALKAANNAKLLSKAFAAVPYLFFAWSVKDAVGTLREDWQDTR
jgi:hypothetical protein